ncbi:MAG: hypothetical protein DCC49_04865 [Acidobacteria bacterium]|nr:MAG: hypothetical protein DCC49_04865 [Acidobacteriota bacterium]
MTTTSTAPDFELTSTEGKTVKLYPITAMWPVLLVFFRSRGEACERIMPMIADFERTYRGADLEILAISQDSRAEARDRLAELGWGGRILIEAPPYSVSKSFGVTELPALVLIGPDNQVLAAAQGADEFGMNSVGRAVAELTNWTYRPVVGEQLEDLEAVPSRS